MENVNYDNSTIYWDIELVPVNMDRRAEKRIYELNVLLSKLCMYLNFDHIYIHNWYGLS